MSKVIDKLIDDIIEFILEDMDCHHEQDHDEDGVHSTAEYSLNDEAKIRAKIGALLKPEVTEEWIWKAIDYIKEYPSYHRLEEKLKEAGVKVVRK